MPGEVLDVGEIMGHCLSMTAGAHQHDAVGALEDLGLLGAVQHGCPPGTRVGAQLAVDVGLGADVDPAVGSSSTTTAGSVSSAAAKATFC